ncbi:MAG: hypothetical protein GX167_07710 [Firmicutes bacterium]|nr:hypothetical protein [Bacillota bacterium]
MDEQLCPLCNGLAQLRLHCPACGGLLRDNGTLQDQLGPYAPYEENSGLRGPAGCMHQVICPFCQAVYHFTLPV